MMPYSNSQVEILDQKTAAAVTRQRCDAATCKSKEHAHRQHTVRDRVRAFGGEMRSLVSMQMAESLDVPAIVTGSAEIGQQRA